MNSNTRISVSNEILKGVLNNGIEYICENNLNAQSVSIMITVRYGSSFNKKSGLAHYLEHLIFKGTKKRPNTNQLMNELDSIGGIHNAYTSKMFTAYFIKVPFIYFEKGLELLTDMIVNPKFLYSSIEDLHSEFEQEKGIIEKELLSIKDNYSRYVHELIEKNIFEYPLDLNYVDDLNDLNKITIEDIIDAYNEYYCGENMIISICGNITKKENIEILLNRYLSSVKKGKKNIYIFEKQKKWDSIKTIDLLKIPNIQNANLSISYQHVGYKSKKIYYMTELFSLIFCDLTSSRLFQSIREKEGLVYTIRSSNYCYDYVGYFSINTNTKVSNLEKVIQKIYDEIKLIKENGITKKEFELSKKNYLGQLILNSENSMNIAEYNAYELYYNKKNFVNYSNVSDIIHEITIDDMNHFIYDFLSKPNILTIIKPT